MSDINELVKDARQRFKHQEAKVYLKEKYKGRLVLPFNGGLFTVRIELLTFLHSQTIAETLVVLDDYANPIRVVPREFYQVMLEKYNEVMEDWYKEQAELNSLR